MVKIDRRAGMKIAAAGLALAFGAGAAFAQETLRFGLAMPLTGSQALYGQDQVKAAEWAVAEINKAGGINGKKLEMIVLDTQADPQIGIQMANRLSSVDKTPVFVTAWSGVVKAVAPIANDNKVVELSIGANSPDVAKLGDYVYTTFPLADVDVTAVAKYAATTMGKKKAAVVYINNETGIVAAEVYKKAFTAAGGQVVAYEAYDQKATDFTGALLKVRAVLSSEFKAFEKRAYRMSMADAKARLLMSTPGVGPIISLTYASAIDDPARFTSSKQAGSHFGLTPKKYQSGEIDRSGRISKIGDASVREALYQAGHIILTKPIKGCSQLKSWAMRIARRAGMNKAKVALARKLAVIMHRMLKDGVPFNPDTKASAAMA